MYRLPNMEHVLTLTANKTNYIKRDENALN